MSQAMPDRPDVDPEAQCAFALVVSRYNSEFTSALEQNARAELLALRARARVDSFYAPGSFEIPLLVKKIAAQGRYDAILALGVILQGETAHAELIAGSITQSLQEIALEHGIPVIHEVLLVSSEAQARARCLGENLNRGREAARAAVATIEALQTLSTH